MKVTSTIQALRDRCPSLNKQVYGALEFTGLANKINPKEFPAAYVFTFRETPKELQRSANSYYQDIVATVAVVVAVPSSDERGQNALDRVEDLKEEIFKAILSWSPTDDPQSIYEYSNFSILDNSRCPVVTFVQLEFDCTYQIGYSDTRQPIQLEEDTSELHEVQIDTDLIKDDKPDGTIELKAQFKDLW